MIQKKLLSLRGILSLLIGCVAFSACTSADDEMEGDKESTDVLAVSVMQENNSGSIPLQSGDIGLFVLGNDASLMVTNRLMNVVGGNVANPCTEGSRYIAYAPYQEDWDNALTESPAFKTSSDQSTQENYEKSDFVAGVLDNSANSAQNGVTLTHLLSKVVVSIVDETGTNDFKTGTSLHLLGMKNVATVDLTIPSAIPIEDYSSDIDMCGSEATDRRLTAMAIVAPQQKNGAEYWIKLNLGKLNYLYRQELALEAGKKTTIKLRFTNEGLMPGGTSVTDWEADDNGSELDAEEYPYSFR